MPTLGYLISDRLLDIAYSGGQIGTLFGRCRIRSLIHGLHGLYLKILAEGVECLLPISLQFPFENLFHSIERVHGQPGLAAAYSSVASAFWRSSSAIKTGGI